MHCRSGTRRLRPAVAAGARGTRPHVSAEPAACAAMGCAGRLARRGGRPLARQLQRSGSRCARSGGARLQPRLAGRRGACGAGRRRADDCGRDALPAGEPARARRSEDGRRPDWPAGPRCARELGARSLGTRACRRCRGRAPVRIRRARQRVCTPVDRRAGRQGLVPRHRGASAEAARRRHGERIRTPAGPTQDRLRVGWATSTT